MYVFALLPESISLARKYCDEIFMARLVWIESSHGTIDSCFLLWVLSAVVVMFVLGICVDMLRSVLFRVITNHVVRKDKDECLT